MISADVIVIGAGIVGAACAHELAAAGLSVHVIDARKGGATNAGMGHLVVMDDNPAELALSQSSLDLWHQWGPRMTADQPACQFTNCGTLWVAANAEEMAAAQLGESSDPKTRAALLFALKVVGQRGQVSGADVQALRDAGFSDEQVVEILAHVALNLFTNYVNLAFAVPVDFPAVKLSSG